MNSKDFVQSGRQRAVAILLGNTILLISLLLFTMQVKAQIPGRPGNVMGQLTVPQGTVSSVYRVSASSGATTYIWTLSPSSAGRIIGGTTSATVEWYPTFLGTAFINCTARNTFGSTEALGLTATVVPASTGITVGFLHPAQQTISYASNPASIIVDQSFGGDGTNYTYKWQSSPNFTDWSYVAGQTTQVISPVRLTATTYYRLEVTSGNMVAYSGIGAVTVDAPVPPVEGGAITPMFQNINYNETASFVADPPTGGGAGTPIYQWTISTDGINFTNVTSGTANSLSYTSGPLTTYTYFRLVSSKGNNKGISSAYVTVYPTLVSGTITGTQTINNGVRPSILRGAAPTGGSGTNTYKWQSSTGGSDFNNIDGAADIDYQPAELTATTSYRLITESNRAKVTSNVVTVTVYPALVAGALVPASQAIAYNTSGASFHVNAATTGGNGPVSYQWTSSPDGVNYTNVSQNVNGLDYTETEKLISPMYYRLLSTNNGGSVNSNAGYVSITIPQLISGILSPVSQNVNYNAEGSLSVTEATGGIGGYRHQWQISADNNSWNDISGASDLFYKPNNLTSSAYYRLVSKSGESVVNSNSGYINVAPVNVSSGHTIRISYTANNTVALSDTANSTIAVLYRAATNSDNTKTLIKGDGTTDYYGADQLSVTVTRDENLPATGRGGTIEEYKDKDGRVVLKRNFNYTGLPAVLQMLSTYYVYDDFGNLSFVLPPGASPDGGAVSQTVLDLYCYQYRYDGRNRLVEKWVPGKGWEYMVYNNLDQVVLTRDANQMSISTQGAYFSRYDGLGRVVVQGIYRYPDGDASYFTRPVIQALVNSQPYLWEIPSDSAIGYTSRTLPEGESFLTDYTIINYYDNYNFPGASTYLYPAGSIKTQGLLTGTKTLVLGTSDMLLNINYYDDKGQLSKVYQQHYLSGAVNPDNYDEISYVYNFDGSQKSSSRIHHNAAVGNTTIANRYAYDHVGRKLKSYEQINGDAEVLLGSYNYNEIGQLRSRGLNNNQQTTGYTYNERGWLKTNTSNEFSFKLKYEDGVSPQYNGNISGQSWGTGAALNNSFAYTYDKLNRLNSGIGSGMSEQLTYDVMGNIRSLNRDELTRNYEYNGNQLTRTIGGPETNSYLYDANGNATVDGRNGQTINYNILNLPSVVAGLQLSYIYDATGKKLRKTSKGVVTDYIGGIQYTNGVIEFIQTEEGLARRNVSSYSYEYNLTDHLGNVRYSFHTSPVTGQLERLQSDDYYPFGLRKLVNPVSLNNKYLYNGKELQEELGQYDYGARFYDPVIGRWNVPDPLSEKYNSIGPYNYTDNNPINNTDPNGAETYYGNDAVTIFSQLQSQLSGNTGPEDPTYSGNKGKPLEEVKVVGRMNLEDMYYSRIERGLDPFSGYSRALSVKGWYDSKISVYNDIKNNQFHGFIYDAASFYAGGEVGGAVLGGMFRYGKGLFKAGELASNSGTTAFRYISEAELQAIREGSGAGFLRGGRAGETFFTKDLYKSAAKAAQRLGLENIPSIRIEFEILNNPTLLRNGTKVAPLNGLMGRGAEFMTLDPVKIRLINWQSLGL